MLDYHARYYDATLGRFISPDSVVPDYTNPQDLNRYSYVRGNPVRFNDPSGHFEEEELKNWFGGEEWYKQFSSEWVHLLRLAELGDAVLSTEDNSTPFIFAMDDNRLSLWNVGTKTAYSVGEVAANNTDVSLYRPKNKLSGGVGLAPEFGYRNGSNIYCPLSGCSENDNVDLPLDWYIGASEGIEFQQFLAPKPPSFLGEASLTLSSIAFYLAGEAALTTMSGGFGTFALAVGIADMVEMKTSYTVTNYPTPLVRPVPTPSVSNK